MWRCGIGARRSLCTAAALALALAGLCAAASLAPAAPLAPAAQPVSAPLASTLPVAGGAPMIRIPQTGHGRSLRHSTSENWAGYDAVGTTFTSVTATWTQPAVAPDALTDRYAAFWVGLDGDSSETVEQIGTEGVTVGGVVTYLAWYEMYPAPAVVIKRTQLSVNPGDQLTGAVTTDGSGSFTLSLVDHTTGRSFTTTTRESAQEPALLASAEVIAETPSDDSGVLPLARFGIVNFSACAFNGQPISAFAWDDITLVSGSGTLATTSALGLDGASFFVSDDFKGPITEVHGAGRTWHRAPVRLRFTATDGRFGSGVAATQSSLDGGATWTTGTSLTVAAPADHSNDGPHTVLYRSIDKAGNTETARGVTVRVDTQRPTPRAAVPASVTRGRRATLRFSVADARPGAPTATVTIRIRTASGRLVKKAVLSRRPVNRGLRYRFECALPKGTYRFSVYATDGAGNVQTAAARNLLVVR